MEYKLPADFEKRMKEYLGEEYDAFVASYDNPEVKGIRFSSNKYDEIEKKLPSSFKIPWVENAIGVVLKEQNDSVTYEYGDDEEGNFRPGKHPYHEAGAYYIQEPSAMSPAIYLDAKPGDRVLDLCAAPGGKSTQIAGMMNGEGILISNEIMPDRAKILSENIERMGVSNALVISEDPRNISDKFAGYFDKILVDAPCSGEGMFRRSEVAVNEWSLENVKLCADRQAWILDEAAKMLRPGGRLVYSTCTFSKDEDEETVKEFLKRHSDFEPEEMKVYDGMKKGFDQIGIRIWPHIANGEGHYVCSLLKKELNDGADNYESRKIMPPCGYQTDISAKEKSELKVMFDFLSENIVSDRFSATGLKNRRFVKFKDQIYLIPQDCPTLSGIKVLRPGLHIGTILKNRFEPGHALAKALSSSEAKHVCELNVIQECDGNIYKYLRGETFNYEGDNGWYLILADSYSAGWGKLANCIMKNHYPKGLRKDLK